METPTKIQLLTQHAEALRESVNGLGELDIFGEIRTEEVIIGAVRHQLDCINRVLDMDMERFNQEWKAEEQELSRVEHIDA